MEFRRVGFLFLWRKIKELQLTMSLVLIE